MFCVSFNLVFFWGGRFWEQVKIDFTYHKQKYYKNELTSKKSAKLLVFTLCIKTLTLASSL